MSVEDKDIEFLKKFFVTKEECNNAMDEAEKNSTKIMLDVELIKQQLKTLVWVGKTTLAAFIGYIVIEIFKLL